MKFNPIDMRLFADSCFKSAIFPIKRRNFDKKPESRFIILIFPFCYAFDIYKTSKNASNISPSADKP